MNQLDQFSKRILTIGIAIFLLFIGASCFVLSIQRVMANDSSAVLKQSQIEVATAPRETTEVLAVGNQDSLFLTRYSLYDSNSNGYYREDISVWKITNEGVRKID